MAVALLTNVIENAYKHFQISVEPYWKLNYQPF